MNSRDFCFWLQGFFEISQAKDGLDDHQLTAIQNHLKLVFKHEIDPSMGGKKHQDELNQIHKPHPDIGQHAGPSLYHPIQDVGLGIMRC